MEQQTATQPTIEEARAALEQQMQAQQGSLTPEQMSQAREQLEKMYEQSQSADGKQPSGPGAEDARREAVMAKRQEIGDLHAKRDRAAQQVEAMPDTNVVTPTLMGTGLVAGAGMAVNRLGNDEGIAKRAFNQALKGDQKVGEKFGDFGSKLVEGDDTLISNLDKQVLSGTLIENNQYQGFFADIGDKSDNLLQKLQKDAIDGLSKVQKSGDEITRSVQASDFSNSLSDVINKSTISNTLGETVKNLDKKGVNKLVEFTQKYVTGEFGEKDFQTALTEHVKSDKAFDESKIGEIANRLVGKADKTKTALDETVKQANAAGQDLPDIENSMKGIAGVANKVHNAYDDVWDKIDGKGNLGDGMRGGITLGVVAAAVAGTAWAADGKNREAKKEAKGHVARLEEQIAKEQAGLQEMGMGGR